MEECLKEPYMLQTWCIFSRQRQHTQLLKFSEYQLECVLLLIFHTYPNILLKQVNRKSHKCLSSTSTIRETSTLLYQGPIDRLTATNKQGTHPASASSPRTQKGQTLVPRQQDRQVTLEHIPALFTSHPTWPDPKAPGPATDAAGLGISLQPWALREGTQPAPRGGSARGKAKWSPRELQTSQPLFPLRPVLLPAIWSSHKQSQ